MLEKLQAQPELLERAFRHVLNQQVCCNLGFVLNAGLGVEDAELLFRDAPPEKPPPADGEEPEPEPELTEEELGKKPADGRIEGRHMPEIVISVDSAEAQKQANNIAVVQYVLDSETAKARNQNVIRVFEKDVTGGGAATMEAVIQRAGRPRHYGFDKSEGEDLTRLQPNRSTAAAGSQETAAAEGAAAAGQVEEKGGELSEKAKKDMLTKQETLLPAVQDELESRQGAADEAARAYALKYALPALHRAMCMAGRLRPDDPVDFVSNFLMHFEELKDSLPEPGKINLPEVGGAKKTKK